MSRSLAMTCLVVALSGCGPKAPELVPRSPHGGELVRLPDGAGFVELLRQDPADRPELTELHAYFLADERRPMASGPAVATLKLQGRRGKTVELKPTNPADSAKAGELASPTFEAVGGIVGQLSATVGGKPITVPIRLR